MILVLIVLENVEAFHISAQNLKTYFQSLVLLVVCKSQSQNATQPIIHILVTVFYQFQSSTDLNQLTPLLSTTFSKLSII